MFYLRRKFFSEVTRLAKIGEGKIIQQVRSVSNFKEKFSLPDQFRGSEDNVWVEFINLSEQYKPLKLDLGFPDFLPPDHIREALVEAVRSPEANMQQYTRSFGHPRLVKAISKLYSKLQNREINPLSEVIITVGAQQALSSAIMGHIKPGDEAVIIEPFYDCYVPLVKAAGGKPVFLCH